MNYGVAQAGANSLIADIKKVPLENIINKWAWANQPMHLGPLQRALDTLSEIMREREIYSDFLNSDVGELRATKARDKKNPDELERMDRYLAEFSEKMDPVIGDLERETRILMSQQRARDEASKKPEERSSTDEPAAKRARRARKES
eukprot:7186259-Pyramimonas_sp.AAC.1